MADTPSANMALNQLKWIGFFNWLMLYPNSSTTDDDLSERVALELIMRDLGRMIAQAGTINQPMRAYLLEMARIEARTQLADQPHAE